MRLRREDLYFAAGLYLANVAAVWLWLYLT